MYRRQESRPSPRKRNAKRQNGCLRRPYKKLKKRREAEVELFYEDLQDLLELTPQKYVLFIIGDWNAEVGSQETPGVTGKFGLGMRNEAGQRLIEFAKRTYWS